MKFNQQIINFFGGDTNIKDMLQIKEGHLKKWKEYFKNLEKTKE